VLASPQTAHSPSRITCMAQQKVACTILVFMGVSRTPGLARGKQPDAYTPGSMYPAIVPHRK
jgi:hypothetical protein